MDTNLNTFQKEPLIEVSWDPTLKNKYLTAGIILLDFSIGIGKEYKELSNTAVKFLVGFSTSNLYEKGFSSLTYLKSKSRNKLNIEDDLRLFLTNLEPNFELSDQQAHPSHF